MFRASPLQLFLLLSPALALMLLVAIFPIAQSIYYSLFDIDLNRSTQTFVGLEHYRALLEDRFYWISIRNTVTFTLAATVVEVALGLALALLFNRQFFGRKIVLPFIVLPMMLSTMVCAAVWTLWFHYDFGMLNHWLRALGLDGVQWLSFDLALWSIVLVDVWQWTPITFLILLAGLQSIPPQVQEAARLDSKSAFNRFIFITLPLIKRHLFLALLLRTVDSFKLFDKVNAMTGGGPGFATETMSTYVYRYIAETDGLARAAAGSVIMLLIAFVLSAIHAWRILTDREGSYA